MKASPRPLTSLTSTRRARPDFSPSTQRYRFGWFWGAPKHVKATRDGDHQHAHDHARPYRSWTIESEGLMTRIELSVYSMMLGCERSAPKGSPRWQMTPGRATSTSRSGGGGHSSLTGFGTTGFRAPPWLPTRFANVQPRSLRQDTGYRKEADDLAANVIRATADLFSPPLTNRTASCLNSTV